MPNNDRYMNTTRIVDTWLKIIEYARNIEPVSSGSIRGTSIGTNKYIPNAIKPYHHADAHTKHSTQNTGTATIFTIPSNAPTFEVRGVVDEIILYATNNQIQISIT